jgi:tetratricopeptide (TPR) repeat protein
LALQARGFRAITLIELGEIDTARKLFDEGLDEARALASAQLEYQMLNGRANLALREDRGEEALVLFEQALLIARDAQALLRMRMILTNIAHVLADVGDAETAARLLSCSDAHSAEITGNFGWIARRREETLTTLAERLDEAVLSAAWERGRAMSLDDGVELALSA